MRRQLAGVRFFLLPCEIELRRSALLTFTYGVIPWPDWGFQMGLAEQRNSGICLRFSPELTKSVLYFSSSHSVVRIQTLVLFVFGF